MNRRTSLLLYIGIAVLLRIVWEFAFPRFGIWAMAGAFLAGLLLNWFLAPRLLPEKYVSPSNTAAIRVAIIIVAMIGGAGILIAMLIS